MTGDVPSAEMAQEVQDPTSNAFPSSDMEVDEGPLPAAAPQQGWFGFTLRELIMIGAWVIAFALSFVPGGGSVLDSSATVWTMNGAWALAIGVPTVAVFLIVLRRLSPEGIRRVGSLGIDQFASVAFSVALVSWIVLLWQQLDLVGATRRSPLVTWPLWLEILLMLVLVVVTVFAALIPGIREDFEERTETLAHRRANPVRPVFSRPRPVRARGSVSDPQNEDDVDPGLLHDNEVGAAGHLSATGVTGAVVEGGTGYVPEQHRESFLASGETPVVAAVEAQASPDAETTVQATVPAVEAPTGVVPAPDAPTEAILDTVPRADSEEEPQAAAEETPEEGEPATRADARRAAAADAEPDSDADAADGPAAALDSTAAPRDLSDTMTEVLGDLLEPSSADDVATHAVDVISQDGGSEPSAAGPVATGEQLQPFWALAPDTRVVHDARGDSIFTIGPEAWILVLEDRGGAFVVRHDDGRVGYLHDTENMTRG
ncbi:MAG: hypothetical protein LBE60_06740 [Microbacterium sp.]|jgi:hypothetical protein|uniref:hypothetical protein n=1 Tax=Microbacterium sp. TaxID=51671 RepID=UPI002822CE48|nr:hypothetical protein [Microbacterium sp.]MDR2321329.1 hypothetical protein [Microbacterium sp.]